MLTSKVFKFRLLTPIISIVSIKHFSNSFSSCISINTSSPIFFANELRFVICFFSRHAAIKSITSAPFAFASII